MKNFFKDLIDSIDNHDKNLIPKINPTEIYNEGWMTRLLVYYSIKQGVVLNDVIDFSKIENWSSEGLISSPFIHVKENREGYTHPDIALGDFNIDYSERGEIIVSPNAKTFGIIEAKMKSNLSQGTTNAKNYNQASRNLACITYNTVNKCNTFFLVVSPLKMIKQHNLDEQVQKDIMINQIKDRFSHSNISIDYDLIAKAENCKTSIISYELWLDLLTVTEKEDLLEFYTKCKKWNRI